VQRRTRWHPCRHVAECCRRSVPLRHRKCCRAADLEMPRQHSSTRTRVISLVVASETFPPSARWARRRRALPPARERRVADFNAHPRGRANLIEHERPRPEPQAAWLRGSERSRKRHRTNLASDSAARQRWLRLRLGEVHEQAHRPVGGRHRLRGCQTHKLNRSGFPGYPNFWKDGVHDEQDDAIGGVSGGAA